MKLNKFAHAALVATICMGVSMPQLVNARDAVAQAQVPVKQVVEDVVLQAGSLQGALVDAAGRGVEDAPVVIGQNGKKIAVLRTDAEGRFAAPGLKAGVYQVVSHGGAAVYRVWDESNAPSAAKQGVIHTVDPQVARGARSGRLLALLTNPIVLALIVAAAIAIPLALDDDDDAS